MLSEFSNPLDSQENWSPWSWKKRPADQQPVYREEEPWVLPLICQNIQSAPILVHPTEILKLEDLVAQAGGGNLFLIQAGDCAEPFTEESSTTIKKKMAQFASFLGPQNEPRVVIGRVAGQYAKPRSHDWEDREKTIPVFRGENVHCHKLRISDSRRLMAGYQQSKKALGAIRRWIEGSSGFFPQGFYISHEGLLLNYEGAMTRWVPEARAFYNLSAHTLWLGHRTQSLGGAHVEYFRGISNPIGLKVGPGSQPGELLDLIRVLNPKNKPGRLTLITRLGAKEVSCGLPPLVEAVEKAKQTVTWMVDPMHGNTRFEVGFKTRYFDDIASEWQETREIHHRLGTVLGGVHLEITPHPGAKECLGGIQNPVLLEDLSKGYKSLCDPRLNPQQVEDLFELLSLSKPQYLL